MQVFFLGGGHLCRWLLQRPGVDFECSWNGLCWVLLVSQGLRGAFFVLVCVTGSLGVLGDPAWTVLVVHGDLLGFPPVHWCLSLWAV